MNSDLSIMSADGLDVNSDESLASSDQSPVNSDAARCVHLYPYSFVAIRLGEWLPFIFPPFFNAYFARKANSDLFVASSDGLGVNSDESRSNYNQSLLNADTAPCVKIYPYSFVAIRPGEWLPFIFPHFSTPTLPEKRIPTFSARVPTDWA